MKKKLLLMQQNRKSNVSQVRVRCLWKDAGHPLTNLVERILAPEARTPQLLPTDCRLSVALRGDLSH